MKTSKSIKANIMAIIMLVVVSAVWHPTIARAETLKSLKLSLMSNDINTKLLNDEETEETPLNLDNLEIAQKNEQLLSDVSSLKIEINVEKLRQINIARKKALELEKKKQEEARRKAEEARLAEEKAKADAKAKELTASSGTSLSYDELVAKLNRSLNSTLAGKGDSFAKYATELGIDPYLAVAIVLHETGCNYTCSTQVKECYNVGGMKGGPSCNGTSYKKFNSLDEGIYSFMYNLKTNYYDKGLTTPEQMNKKYAASKAWAGKIHHYINKIQAS